MFAGDAPNTKAPSGQQASLLPHFSLYNTTTTYYGGPSEIGPNIYSEIAIYIGFCVYRRSYLYALFNMAPRNSTSYTTVE